MRTNYILVDYENVQPKNLELLVEHSVKVFVFVGNKQSKIPFEFADAVQSLGSRGEYVRIDGTGPNALDFHIACYLGRLSKDDPQGYFHIISKDKGFDPLIDHNKKALNLLTHRSEDISEIPFLKNSQSSSTEDKLKSITASLVSRGQSRPRKEKALSNTINALFQKQLSDSELAEIINQLALKKVIQISDGKVSYDFDKATTVGTVSNN